MATDEKRMAVSADPLELEGCADHCNLSRWGLHGSFVAHASARPRALWSGRGGLRAADCGNLLGVAAAGAGRKASAPGVGHHGSGNSSGFARSRFCPAHVAGSRQHARVGHWSDYRYDRLGCVSLARDAEWGLAGGRRQSNPYRGHAADAASCGLVRCCSCAVGAATHARQGNSIRGGRVGNRCLKDSAQNASFLLPILGSVPEKPLSAKERIADKVILSNKENYSSGVKARMHLQLFMARRKPDPDTKRSLPVSWRNDSCAEGAYRWTRSPFTPLGGLSRLGVSEQGKTVSWDMQLPGPKVIRISNASN